MREYCGTVTQVHEARCQAYLLLDTPGFGAGLAVHVPPQHRWNFGPNLEAEFFSARVCVAGTVSTDLHPKLSTVSVARPAQIRVTDPGTPPAFGRGAYHTTCTGSGLEAPRLVKQVAPEYTPEAMTAKVEGTVVLEAVVLPSGQVGDVRIIRPLLADLGLNQAAVETLQQWRFTPGTKDGAPVPFVITAEVVFKLGGR